MQRLAFLFLCAFGLVGVARAEGSISDHGAVFSRDQSAWGLGSAEFTGVSTPASTNHLTSVAWAYRVQGDTRETFLPAPDSQFYGIAVSEHHWADVDSRGLFSATETAFIFGPTTDAPSGRVQMQLTLTNLSATDPLTIDLFHAIDMEVGGGSLNAGMLLSDITVPSMKFTAPNGDRGYYLGNDADRYTARPFGPNGVRAILSDNDIDDFDDGGLPAESMDLTAGVQWGNRTLQPGESKTFDIAFAINRPALTPDLSITLIDSPDPVMEDTTLEYSVAVGNVGPYPAPGVVVTFDALPDGVDIVGSDGCDNDPAGYPQCQLGTLASGQSRAMALQVIPTKASPSQISMSATVSAPDVVDIGPENNTATALTTVLVQPRADLRLLKTNDVGGVAADIDGWHWQLTLRNLPSATADATFAAGDVLLLDQLPGQSVVYGVAVLAFPGNEQGPDVSGTATCSIAGFDLTCIATSPMTFVPGSSVSVSIPVFPQAVQLYANPRPGGGLCSADPGNAVDEQDEANNSCSDTVLSIDFMLFGDGFED